MAMSPIEYNQLSLDERAELVFTEGKYTADIAEYYRHKVVLYALYNFWVEVFYNLDDNVVEAVRLAGPEKLDKYLNRIKIDSF